MLAALVGMLRMNVMMVVALRAVKPRQLEYAVDGKSHRYRKYKLYYDKRQKPTNI